MSFAPDFGKQCNMELSCDWSQCGEAWQTYPVCDIPQDSSRESVHTVEKGKSLTCAGIIDNSGNCSDPSKDATASCTPKLDGYVYKRRKLRRNIVVLSEESAEASKESDACHYGTSSVVHPLTVQKNELNGDMQLAVDSTHSFDSGNPSTSGQLDLQKHIVPSAQNTYVRRRIPKPFQNLRNKLSVVVALPAQVSSGKRCESYTVHGSAATKTEVNTTKHSLTNATRAGTIEDCISAREICTSVLKSQELVTGLNTADCCASSEQLSVITNITLLCKACGNLENTQKMLICDLCEEAFHLSCCNPKVKKLPLNMWYCQPCFKKKRKILLENVSSEDRDKKFKLGPRVGREFQVEVPAWAGPTISDGHDYFDNPLRIDPDDYVSLWDRKADRSSEDNFIGNWIQCQEVMDDNEKDESIICGKWRRAPLFVVQTDVWDCSCSLPWDPVHADCAVPQELETEVVLAHLKYIEMLRPKVDNKHRLQSK